MWTGVEPLLLGGLSAPGEQHGVGRMPLRPLDVLGRRQPADLVDRPA
jgi:hypothetical protein